ncbi:phosphatidic acid transfer protein [Malassezia pachydermatis]
MSADLNQKNPLPLGQMESMAPECTPLKEKYDTCFHTWFKDYLDVSSVLHEGASNQADRWHVRGSLFSASNNQVHKIAALRARYDNDCKSLFTEYQACVKNAIKERGLEQSIEKARKENPFPLQHER